MSSGDERARETAKSAGIEDDIAFTELPSDIQNIILQFRTRPMLLGERLGEILDPMEEDERLRIWTLVQRCIGRDLLRDDRADGGL